MTQTYKEISKINYRPPTESVARSDIDTGSLQRIADACEIMAKDKQSMTSTIEYLSSRKNGLEARLTLERRRSASYKGQATKLRKKILELERTIGNLIAGTER